MTSLELNIFSPSESQFIKSLLKNPDEDFEKLVSLLEKNTRENSKQLSELEDKYYSLIDGLTHVGIGMDIVSKQYEVIFQNQVLKERFGDCKGKHCYRGYMGLKEPCEYCPMENALKYNRIERTELDAPDGRSYELISAPYPNKDGSVDKVAEVVIDITDRKRMEQKLKESEEKYRVLTEQSLMGIFIMQEGRFKYINQALSDINGYSVEEMLNWTEIDIAKTIYSEDLTKIMKNLKRSEEGDLDNYSSSTFRIITKSGKLKWIEEYNNKIFYQGKPASLVTLIDISSKIESEQKLKDSETKFRHLFHNLPISISIFDSKANLVESNKLLIKTLSEYGQLDFIGKNYVDILPYFKNAEQLLKLFKERLNKMGQGKEPGPVELYLITKTGKKVWLNWQSSIIKINNEDFFQVLIQDITDRKEAEEKIRDSEEKFRTLTEQSFLGITILQDNIVTYVNNQLANLFGYTVEEIMNWDSGGFINVIHPDDRQMVREQARKKQLGESDVVNQYQFRGIKKNGDMIWLEIFSKTINYRGKLADFVTIHDITDEKLSEQKLKESEEKFRKITEESLLAICIIQDNVIKYINQEMANIYGYTEEEMYNWEPGYLLKTVAPESLEIVKEQLRKKQAGDPDVIIHYPIQCVRKNGELFWVDNLSKTMMYEGRPADLVTQIDITERIKAQQELIKLNQLKSELLRRTSHELKTPLVSIKGFTELLLEVHRDKLDAVVISTLNEIQQGCSRLENLIGDILKTAELESGATKLQKSEEDLSFLIRVCVNEIKGFSKLRNHTINLGINDELITHFEKEQIHQVIGNLLNNAVKYTPPSGLIEVKSEIKDDFIILSIKDSGIGFTEEEKTRLFKQFGKIERYGQGLDIIAEGSGFGLFISKKIIELHGGDIWVESEGRNKGSTFYISLPLI